MDFKKAEQTLCDAVQLLTGWHADIAWTEWDDDVKNRCVDLLKQLSEIVRLQSSLSKSPVAPVEPKKGYICENCGGDTRDYCSEDL